MNSFKIRLVTIISFSFISLNVFSQNGYEIRVKIPALKDTTIILAHSYVKDNSFIPDDTIRLNKKGLGVFKGQTPLAGGMYIVVLPTKRYFDLILGDNQSLSIEADTSDLLKGIKFQGSIENVLFYQYRDLIRIKSELASKLNEKKKKATSEQQKDSISKAIDRINQEVVGYIKKTINDNPKLYVSTWLKSLQEIEVPDFPRDLKGNIIDSSFQYHYLNTHYFDNFNLADVRLLHTPYYEKKVKYYLEKLIPQHPDSINKEIDWIMERAGHNEELNHYMLGMLYNHYATLANQIVGMDGVFIYFAEKYYLPQASWSDNKFKENLKKEIGKIKPNLIGKVAPDLSLIEIPTDHFMVAKTDTALKSNPYVGTPINIQQIKAKFLVIAFWEADCGHCKKAIPLLYDSIYPRIKDYDTKILAMHMISSVEGKRKWIDFVNERGMYDWINAWSPYSYEYKDLYNVYKMPTIYVLDENKNIIAKRIGVEQIESVINFELRKK